MPTKFPKGYTAENIVVFRRFANAYASICYGNFSLFDVEKRCFHGEKRLFSWWKNAENAVEKRRFSRKKRRFCISKTAFSDSGMVFSCFEMAKCEKFHADFRFHFLAFRLRKVGNGVLIFANVMRNMPFSMLECGVRGLHCCGLKITLLRIEKEKGEIRVAISPFADCEQA